MKKIYNINRFIFRSLIVLTLIISCSDDFLEQDTRSIVGPESLYVDEAGFDAGLNGLYASARIERAGRPSSSSPTGTSNNLICTMMMSGTDIIYGNRPLGNNLFLNDWGDFVLSGNAQNNFRDTFNWLYAMINAANTVINRGENFSGDIAPENMNRILAEARTIRAWCYRHLTFLFGDVPLNLEESAGENIRTDWERNSVAEIRAQMKEDLEFGVQYLPENFINDGKIIKAVAQHYLTELLIIEQDYEGAINMALDAINGPRALVTNRYGVKASEPGTPFTDMFLDGNSNPSEGNTEALWVFQHEFEVEGGQGHNIMRRWFMSEYSSTSGGAPGLAVTLERGGRGLTRASATKFMLDLYERDGDNNVVDDRGGEYAWRHFFTIIEQDPSSAGAVGDTLFLDFTPDDPLGDRFRPYVRKWDYDTNINTDDDPLSDRSTRAFNDQIYLRLADTYLLLAEAYFLNGDPENAKNYINDLRDRANATPITAGDVSLDFILDERARELYSEEQRRYTLLRTGKWIERTNAHNVNASGKINPNRDVLYPIPQTFIDANLDNPIENNPGY